MDNLRTHFNLIFSLIATQFVAVLGGWDFSLKFLLMLVAFDYATGVLKGIYLRTLSSSVGFWGILKKLCIFLVIATAAQLDHLVAQNAPVIRTIVIWFYISNEGISMLENLSALGVPIPKTIRSRLFKLQEADNNE